MQSSLESDVGSFTDISLARKSLMSTALLDKADYKGNKENPSYAIDSDVEGTKFAVDRGDEELTVLELGKKYMEIFGEAELIFADLSGTIFEDLHKPLKPYPGAIEAFNLYKIH